MRNIIGLWRDLFRAIEVAKTGGHSVSIHFDPIYKNGFDDYNSIKSFCEGWFGNFVPDGDIKVEITMPLSYTQKGNCETLRDISLRIEKSLLSPKPKADLCRNSEALLEVACRRLELSFSQFERVKQIAATIARMDLSKTIQVQHIAEAIQYSFVDNDAVCNAESESKIFGGMIQVKMGEIDGDAIRAAIDYLNGLLGLSSK